MKSALWPTSRVAKKLGIEPQTVRLYDDVLIPMRTSNGTRYYDPNRVEAFAQLREQRSRVK
jgi:DNA-binding transcriptional MerR regulator